MKLQIRYAPPKRDSEGNWRTLVEVVDLDQQNKDKTGPLYVGGGYVTWDEQPSGEAYEAIAIEARRHIDAYTS